MEIFMEDTNPGRNNESFQIRLNASWFQKGDTLKFGSRKLLINKTLSKLQILTVPKRYNFKWYHRLINKLTFGYLCPTGYYYKVKLID